MTVITDYDEYMQRQPRLQPRIRCITLEHPSWVYPLYLCLDDVKGLTSGGIFYQFAQVSEREKAIKTSLEYGFDVGIGGYNIELFNIIKKTNWQSQPFIKYKHLDFNAKDTSNPMRVIDLEVTAIEIKKGKNGNVASFEAVPPKTTTNKTGLIYSINDAPMLEAFL